MNLQQLLLIFKARYKIALITFLVIVLSTLAISLIVPPRYTATTSVVVDVRSADPIAGDRLDGPVTPAYLPTQVDIINSNRTADKVVKALHLAENPAVREKWQKDTGGRGQIEPWIAQLMQKGLKVHPSPESNVIMLTYVSADPQFSATAANAFAKAYIDTNIELKTDPAKDYAKWFVGQTKVLRDNLEAAQARLASYQKKKGIAITDDRLDNEMAKLNDLSSQLTIVEALTADAQSKQQPNERSSSLNDVRENSLIMNLKAEINTQEAKLQEAAGNLGVNHPQYKSMKAQIDSLKKQLAEETRNITKSFVTTEDVTKDKAENLRKLIAAQKQKILDLKNERDAAAVLLNDVANAQKAYDAVSQRYTQTNLQGQSDQTNVSILTPAIAPLGPSSPLPVLYTLIAAAVGIVLGIAMAFTMEMLDRRVRVASDIEQNLGLPVLAELSQQQSAVTRWWKKLRLFRRSKTLEFAT
ncbi:MAG TPA: chain length determinant protein EpsF [Methylophilaceae bacterium]|nr:chain length determinant protein EpsF [Methylophilaceae bacterium]